jgi:site-specific DNA-methyltransferase (adenine-specific)
MPENTEHPAQKPEKLIAKLILASCPENGVVLDPFLGSGTTSVSAKKLFRTYVGIEMNEAYCCWAEKRLAAADTDKNIQGYSGGVFWERNSLYMQRKNTASTKTGCCTSMPPPPCRQNRSSIKPSVRISALLLIPCPRPLWIC